MNRRHHECDDSTQELPPVITEKARVSLPFAVLLPALITLGGGTAWATKFYLGQVETQDRVAKLAVTLTEIQHQQGDLKSQTQQIQEDQSDLKSQTRQIQADLGKIRAALGPPLSGITKTTPRIDVFTTQELPANDPH